MLLPMVVLLCFFSWSPKCWCSVGWQNTSLASHFQTLTNKMKWLSTRLTIRTSTLMVTVSVVSIVEVVITSTFKEVSTFSTVIDVTTSTATTFSTYLTITCCYGICSYNICFYNIWWYNIQCYNICFSNHCYLCFFFLICFLSPSVGVVLGGRNASLVARFQHLIRKMECPTVKIPIVTTFAMVSIVTTSTFQSTITYICDS